MTPNDLNAFVLRTAVLNDVVDGDALLIQDTPDRRVKKPPLLKRRGDDRQPRQTIGRQIIDRESFRRDRPWIVLRTNNQIEGAVDPGSRDDEIALRLRQVCPRRGPAQTGVEPERRPFDGITPVDRTTAIESNRLNEMPCPVR